LFTKDLISNGKWDELKLKVKETMEIIRILKSK